jgi:hypothetical protein
MAANVARRLAFRGFVAISKVNFREVLRMKLRVGFEMHYEFPQPTPMIMVLGTHFTRASDIIVPDYLTTGPSVPITPYRDMFGNWCSRIVAPAGHMRLYADGVINDSGLPDPVFASAAQHPIEDLPPDTLVYLLGSRYCETDCRISPGTYSRTRSRDGRGCRPSATSSIIILRSVTSTPAPPRRRGKLIAKAKAYAATMPTLPWRFAAA